MGEAGDADAMTANYGCHDHQHEPAQLLPNLRLGHLCSLQRLSQSEYVQGPMVVMVMVLIVVVVVVVVVAVVMVVVVAAAHIRACAAQQRNNA